VAEDVTHVVQQMYHALTKKDLDWFSERLDRNPDAVHIGAGYTESLSSDAMVQDLERFFGDMSMNLRPGKMTVDQRGDVAWVVDTAVVGFDDGSELTFRATLVFVTHDGVWKLAHSHLSLPEEASADAARKVLAKDGDSSLAGDVSCA